MNLFKPCPFCGKSPTLRTVNWNNGTTSYRMTCVNDYCQVRPSTDDYSTADRAIECWNHRPDDKRKEDLLRDVHNLEIKLDELDMHLKQKDVIIRKQALMLSETNAD